MALIVVVAFGMAGLRSPTPLWAGAFYTLTLAGLGLAIPGIVYRRGSRRAFWVGFAAFGWGYWLASLSPWVGEAIAPHLVTSTVIEAAEGLLRHRTSEDLLREKFRDMPDAIQLEVSIAAGKQRVEVIRRRVRDESDPALVRERKNLAQLEAMYQDLWVRMSPALRLGAAVSTGGATLAAPIEGFGRIAHSLIALLSGLVGGMIAVRFYRTRDDGEPCPDDRSNSAPSTT
jgi:hypothetical protein